VNESTDDELPPIIQMPITRFVPTTERLQDECPHPTREPSGTPGRSPEWCPDCGKTFFPH